MGTAGMESDEVRAIAAEVRDELRKIRAALESSAASLAILSGRASGEAVAVCEKCAARFPAPHAAACPLAWLVAFPAEGACACSEWGPGHLPGCPNGRETP